MVTQEECDGNPIKLPPMASVINRLSQN